MPNNNSYYSHLKEYGVDKNVAECTASPTPAIQHNILKDTRL